MGLPLITNIQKYSIHDGEGIRTTVFFKGCPLVCAWCHNPETQKFCGEFLTYEERCRGCGACAENCPSGAVRVRNGRALTDSVKCTDCGRCLEECFYNARERCGRTWEVSELVRELSGDRIFYETSGGGVTLSGGEVMAQDMDYVESLLKELHRRGISVYVDTCGAAEWERFERALPYVEVFLYDVKMMDSQKHKYYTGIENRQILENLRQLSRRRAGLWIRLPLIGGVNDGAEDLEQMGRFLTENKIRFSRINLLPYHNTGSGKYKRLGQVYEGEKFREPGEASLTRWRERLEALGLGPVLVGG